MSGDAVLLMTAHVVPEFAGGGLGRMLVQGVAKDLTAARGAGDRGVRPTRDLATSRRCMLPADFLLAVGFKTVRPHPAFPRLRLDAQARASWREDVEVALERLLGSMTPEAALRPGVAGSRRQRAAEARRAAACPVAASSLGGR